MSKTGSMNFMTELRWPGWTSRWQSLAATVPDAAGWQEKKWREKEGGREGRKEKHRDLSERSGTGGRKPLSSRYLYLSAWAAACFTSTLRFSFELSRFYFELLSCWGSLRPETRSQPNIRVLPEGGDSTLFVQESRVTSAFFHAAGGGSTTRVLLGFYYRGPTTGVLLGFYYRGSAGVPALEPSVFSLGVLLEASLLSSLQ